jgi:hypothetical protein
VATLATTPHPHDNLFGESTGTTPFTCHTVLIGTKLEHRRAKSSGAFIPLLQQYGVDVVNSWNDEKDLLLKDNYIEYATKQNYVKMLIT